MTRRQFVRSMVSLLAAFCLSNSAHAQSGPVNGAPVPAPPIYQAQPNAGLSEQALEAAIKALDPNCKVQLTDDQKGKVYSFVINRDGWAYNLRVTSFNNLMWLEASLSGPMSSPQNLPSATLAQLLALNYNIGPTHFAFNKAKDGASTRLYLCLLITRTTLENFDICLNNFLKNVKDTYPTWSQVK